MRTGAAKTFRHSKRRRSRRPKTSIANWLGERSNSLARNEGHRVNASEKQQLLQIFVGSEEECFTVTFCDGSAYKVKVLSSMHAEEGGDIVADVMETIKSAGEPPNRWSGAAMNFRLEDVARVQKG